MLAPGSGRVSIPGVPEPSAALAAAIAALVAAAGWQARALTLRGALAAVLLGTAILSGGGWEAGAVLLTFFVAGSAVSRLMPEPATAFDTKGDRRDEWQVLANGAAPAAGAWLTRDQGTLPLWIVTVSLAAAAADTWATTWGARSGSMPRHIVTGQPLPRGSSGGITARGTIGGALGGLLVGTAGGLVSSSLSLALAATVIGTLGMLLDSLLGALLQGRFRCPTCNQLSERRWHRCGSRTVREAGWSWLGNDGVNALATLCAAVGGALAWRYWAA